MSQVYLGLTPSTSIYGSCGRRSLWVPCLEILDLRRYSKQRLRNNKLKNDKFRDSVSNL